MYDGSVDIHRYKAALKNEKDSFEKLIKTKSSMVISPFDFSQLDSSSYSSSVSNDSRRMTSSVTTGTGSPSALIVDTREFRSSLPNMLDLANMKLIPATIVVIFIIYILLIKLTFS